MALIQINSLMKTYNGFPALNLSELNIEKGESFGLVGNNGAGKTTLFSLILDLIQPSQGTVHLKGQAVHGSEHWKRFTGSYLDEGFVINYLRPEEYFEFVAGLYGISQSQCYQE